MVIDTLENSAQYESLHPGLAQAFAYIRCCLGSIPEDGRVDLDGERLYAMAQSYGTTPEHTRKWESHRRYMDVQFMLEGEEAMLWAPADTLTPSGEYVLEKDFQGYEDGPSTALRCGKGTFVLFWPQDAHKPGCALAEPSPVKKIVVKVRL